MSAKTSTILPWSINGDSRSTDISFITPLRTIDQYVNKIVVYKNKIEVYLNIFNDYEVKKTIEQ